MAELSANKEWRKEVGLQESSKIHIVYHPKPGLRKGPCYECCFAPSFCPGCSILPCCTHPEYITKKIEESSYVYVRENSVEFNSPTLTNAKGSCCGNAICEYAVQDVVSVIYFDDRMIDEITDKTRCCNECRTAFFGGHGQLIRFASTCCCGACVNTQLCCMCVPSCCCSWLCPIMLAKQVWVEDSHAAIVQIQQQRDRAREFFAQTQQMAR